MINISNFIRDYAYNTCLHDEEYECEKQKNCYDCLYAQVAKHNAEVRAKAISELEQKIYELQLKYEKEYGCAIPEMYADVVCDLLDWIKEETNNEQPKSRSKAN